MNIPNELSHIKLPASGSHKGQNGRLLIIGGSHLFHAASLWSLQIASRIVDLVHYSSVSENNQLVHELKKEFRNGIIIPRHEIESYITEDDCILIGPGMVRTDTKDQKLSARFKINKLRDLEMITDEGWQTAALTQYLLEKYPHKQWVIDAGALQMIDVTLIPKGAVLTPHHKEFDQLKLKSQNAKVKNTIEKSKLIEEVKNFAKEHKCILLLKGEVDIVSDGERVQKIAGGNAGMTKGGTGDVLAGLIAALTCESDPYAAAVAGSYINKVTGESLFKRMGYFFNASDLAQEIPKVMKKVLLKNSA